MGLQNNSRKERKTNQEATASKSRPDIYEYKCKKILVVGGSGVTGRLIVEDILRHLHDVEVDIGSRNIHNSSLNSNKVGKVHIDLYDEASAVNILSNYDLVVISVGPFDIFRNRPHRLCMEAGVDCIDVNDNIYATLDIFKLDREAQRKGVKILTGMGLNPGLMTLMLMSVVKKLQKGSKQVRLRLFIGGKQEAGYASVHVVLTGFHLEVSEMRDGEFCYVKANDKEKESLFLFPNFDKSVPVMHCSTPQTWTFGRYSDVDTNEIQRFDFRIYFQGVSVWMVNILRKWSWLKKSGITMRLAKVIYRLHGIMKDMPGNISDTTALAQCTCNNKTYRAYVTGHNSYEMTARFASVIVELVQKGKVFLTPGVHCLEDGFIGEELLRETLKTREIDIVYEEC